MAVTVYELIQELSKYRADTEVRFHVEANFSADIEAEFNRKDESDIQDITANITFDDYVSFDEMQRSYYHDDNEITIDLKY